MKCMSFECDSPALLLERWEPLLRPKGIALKLAGVFCHGHPQVSFGAPPNRVELADLLIVHQHTKGSRVSARALLLQAKMSTDSTHRLSASDPQLQLFSTWPSFEFVTGGLAPGLRNIKEKGKGSRYALVHDGSAYPEHIMWTDQCPWATSPARTMLAADRSLARLLGDILLNKDGRPFQLGKPKDDWSRTIHELLQITGKRTYKRENIKRGPTLRSSGNLQVVPGVMFAYSYHGLLASESPAPRASILDRYFGAAPTTRGDGSDNILPPVEQLDQPPGGISSLIIETAEGMG